MKNATRRQLVEVADAMIDGARQCPHMERDAVARMTRDLAGGASLITDPSVEKWRAKFDGVLASVQGLSEDDLSFGQLIADLLQDLIDFRTELLAMADVT